jgi:glycosyltransferase involved in cell wall biosynthesis
MVNENNFLQKQTVIGDSMGDALKKAKAQSEIRLLFWKTLLNTPHKNLKLVFVSKYLAENVMEDLELTIPDRNYEVIHNYIHTELFTYIAKDPIQRKKILSIRPYANKNYANDLSVEAILELSQKPYFHELEFRLIGDGVLFDKTLKPLRKFDNVIIEKRFLSQQEIADIHKEYGIFLCPSRMDTQGVSRDEAMSSGLVPVSNGVTAIPEFVDDTCGILAEAEDAHGLAEGIATLYENPELFQEMSEAAAKRVRLQCSLEETITKELIQFDT